MTTTKTKTHEDLAARLLEIGMRHVAANLDDVVAKATSKRWGPIQLLEALCELETDDRAQRSLERRLRRSRLGTFKPLADFDWTWPTKIDRRAVEGVMTLDFLEGAGNVVLVAPQGLGKTMLAKNIGYQAARVATTALWINCHGPLGVCSRTWLAGIPRRRVHSIRLLA